MLVRAPAGIAADSGEIRSGLARGGKLSLPGLSAGAVGGFKRYLHLTLVFHIATVDI